MIMQSHAIRVLLVDDDEDDYIIVRDLLSDLFSIEFILKWVSDYGAALDAIHSSEFDVCLLDYRLKERNGLELMQEAVSRGARTPIIFLTGQEGYDLDLEAMGKGAADWLTKGELSSTLLERSIRHAMERQRKREELVKAKRVIQALSECNHAVIHINDEAELLRAICRIVVDVGGYRMALMEYAEEDQDQTVMPVGGCGYEKDYPEKIRAPRKDIERGRGTTATCIRTGPPGVFCFAGRQAEFAPWKVKDLKRDHASAISLPLFLDGQRLGALTIYSSETEAFDTEEVEFLVELSGNLSYGIGVLRLREAQMQAEESLKEAYLGLERRVEERTAELIKVNAELRREVEERRQAEDALRLNERRLRRAEVVARFGNWEFILGSDEVKCSEGARVIYGLDHSEWSIRAVQSITLPEYRDMLDKALDELIEEGKPYNVQFKIRRPTDGKIVDIHSIAKYSPEKGVVFGAIQDITERKQAEEALQRSEREKTILNEIANVFLTIPDENIYEEVLAVILKALKCRYGVFGYIGDGGDLIIPSMTREIWSDCQVEGKSIVFSRHLWGDSLWGKAIMEKKSFSSDGPFQTPEGHLPVYNFLTVPIVFADKTIGLASGANKDGGFSEEDKTVLERIAGSISPILNTRLQRDKQELERKQAEEKYRDIFENSVTGIYQATLEGHFLKVNAAMAHIFGYDPPEELLNMVNDVRQLYVHPERRSEMLRLIEKHGAVREFEVECFRKDKSVVWVALNIRTVRDSTGQIAYLEGTASDITDRKLLKARLDQAQKMEAIGTLAGGIAHDFNNILTPIIGYSELSLGIVPKDDKLSHNMRQVLVSANRAKDLVKQILTFSRKTKEEKRPVRVSIIINEALKLLRSSLPSTIEIRQSIHPDAIDSATMADPTQIHQVLMNLCTNAAHALRERPGTLAITLENVDIGQCGEIVSPDLGPGPYLRLLVSDTGCGMDAALQQRIFDPYFTTKGPDEGTGLGLAVVYGIVKDLSGAIAVLSEPGEGTTFEVYFPRTKTIAALSTESPEILPTGHGLVLVVDDENFIVDMVKEMLETLGYETVARYSSVDALEAFRARPESFDLVITDMTMPRMTGTGLAKEIFMIRPNTPIILCTGFSEAINENEVKQLGIKELLLKPVSMRDLAGAVSKTLARERLLSGTTV